MPPVHIILFLYLYSIYYSYHTAMTAIELSNLRSKYEGNQVPVLIHKLNNSKNSPDMSKTNTLVVEITKNLAH